MGKVKLVEPEDATPEDFESSLLLLERHGFLETFIGPDGKVRWRRTEKPMPDDWVPPDDGLQS